MCGIAGVLAAGSIQENSFFRDNGLTFDSFVQRGERLRHRGGDGFGTWHKPSIWALHHRLAFQDVDQGQQPMILEEHKIGIVFNGEIYNHLSLRLSIESKLGHKVSWKTKSDTETILWSYVAYGEECSTDFDGEFAFVIFDLHGKFAFFTRDPFGVKPLFLHVPNFDSRRLSIHQPQFEFSCQGLSFASEIKGLPISLKWERDGFLRQATGLFEPICTPFESVIQIPGGAKLFLKREVNHGIAELKGKMRTKLGGLRKHPTVHRTQRGDFKSIEEQALRQGEFSRAFRSSVENRLLSDVPLGVYLSGGIDSMAVAQVLASSNLSGQSSDADSVKRKRPLDAFTVGFQTSEYDERAKAVAFAKNYGLVSHVISVSNSDLQYSYPHAVYASENVQPYTNGAAKWWLSLKARTKVRGVLTGDGADELLCGYSSYAYCAYWQYAMNSKERRSQPWRQALAASQLGSQWRDHIFVKRFAGESMNPWLAGMSSFGDGSDFAISLGMWGVAHPLMTQIVALSKWLLPGDNGKWLESVGSSVRSLFSAGSTAETLENQWDLENPKLAMLHWQNYFSRTHLPVQVLNWVGDRMEMANNLEGRTPFLGSPMQSWVQSATHSELLAGFENKVSLRRYLSSTLQKNANWSKTPKMQFGAPFLDSQDLVERYDTKRFVDSLGILGSKDFENLMATCKKEVPITSGKLVFEKAYANSCLQTLLCASIVNDSLVLGNVPQRDFELEGRRLEGIEE